MKYLRYWLNEKWDSDEKIKIRIEVVSWCIFEIEISTMQQQVSAINQKQSDKMMFYIDFLVGQIIKCKLRIASNSSKECKTEKLLAATKKKRKEAYFSRNVLAEKLFQYQKGKQH